MDATFKPGDLVRLKSGGPVLTIIAANAADACFAWFVDGQYRNAECPTGALVLVDAFPVHITIVDNPVRFPAGGITWLDGH